MPLALFCSAFAVVQVSSRCPCWSFLCALVGWVRRLGDGAAVRRVGKNDGAAGADGHGKPWPVPDRQPGNAPCAIRPVIPCPPEQGGRGPSGCKQGFPVLCDPCPGGPEVRPLRFGRAGVRGAGLVRGVHVAGRLQVLRGDGRRLPIRAGGLHGLPLLPWLAGHAVESAAGAVDELPPFAQGAGLQERQAFRLARCRPGSGWSSWPG